MLNTVRESLEISVLELSGNLVFVLLQSTCKHLSGIQEEFSCSRYMLKWKDKRSLLLLPCHLQHIITKYLTSISAFTCSRNQSLCLIMYKFVEKCIHCEP